MLSEWPFQLHWIIIYTKLLQKSHDNKVSDIDSNNFIFLPLDSLFLIKSLNQ